MTYSVKSIYPEFKCLTAHKAVMKRIETAQKKSDKKYKAFKYIIIKNYKMVGDEGFYNKKIYTREFEEDCKKEEAKFLEAYRFRHKYGKIGNNHQLWIEENHRAKKANPWFYNRNVFEPKHYDVCGGSYGIDNKPKEVKFFLWKLNKMNEIDKRIIFYDAMISRDYKAVTLCDDVIGLIYEYL